MRTGPEFPVYRFLKIEKEKVLHLIYRIGSVPTRLSFLPVFDANRELTWG